MSRSLLLCFVFDGALVFQMDSAVGWQGSLSWEIQSERKSSTEALCWAWDAPQTPGDVGDQELMSTLGLAP